MYDRIRSSSRLANMLRGEQAASEVYEHALDLTLLPHQHDELQHIKQEHLEAAESLRPFVAADAALDTEPGGWDVLSHAVNGVERLYGRMATIKSIQDGEQLAIHDLIASLRDHNLPENCKTIIKTRILPQAFDHVKRLGRIIKERSELVELL
jgi:hypothetical protein